MPPWKERDTMSLREEFVIRARMAEANVRALCREFGIAPATAYKWLNRYGEAGEEGLREQSRRPETSPRRTPSGVEARVLALRDEEPAWGPRKLRRRLQDLGMADLPSASTVGAILKRSGRIDPQESPKHRPFVRFERDGPNDMWQVDFKGHFPLQQGGRCHPLVVVDDHSRFLLGLDACADEQGTTVQERLTAIFRRHGLPQRILLDNGSPWGSDPDHCHTPLTVWLFLIGVVVTHQRPYHPQTKGKVERLNRTLDVEVLARYPMTDLPICQGHFDYWRPKYNHERPHDALDLWTPASRYTPSPRPFPETLPVISYDTGVVVRRVQHGGWLSFHGKQFRVGKAFRGYPLALSETEVDGVWSVRFLAHEIRRVDLRC